MDEEIQLIPSQGLERMLSPSLSTSLLVFCPSLILRHSPTHSRPLCKGLPSADMELTPVFGLTQKSTTLRQLGFGNYCVRAWVRLSIQIEQRRPLVFAWLGDHVYCVLQSVTCSSCCQTGCPFVYKCSMSLLIVAIVSGGATIVRNTVTVLSIASTASHSSSSKVPSSFILEG